MTLSLSSNHRTWPIETENGNNNLNANCLKTFVCFFIVKMTNALKKKACKHLKSDNKHHMYIYVYMYTYVYVAKQSVLPESEDTFAPPELSTRTSKCGKVGVSHKKTI